MGIIKRVDTKPKFKVVESTYIHNDKGGSSHLSRREAAYPTIRMLAYFPEGFFFFSGQVCSRGVHCRLASKLWRFRGDGTAIWFRKVFVQKDGKWWCVGKRKH